MQFQHFPIILKYSFASITLVNNCKLIALNELVGFNTQIISLFSL